MSRHKISNIFRHSCERGLHFLGKREINNQHPMTKYTELKRESDDAIELKEFSRGSEKPEKILGHSKGDDGGLGTAMSPRGSAGRSEPSFVSNKNGVLLATALVISSVMIGIHVVSCLLCNGGVLTCRPQYGVRIDDSTPEAKQMISVAEDALKTLSYFAKDHSVMEEEFGDGMQYMDVIDTFSNHNKFQFNFNGFCRHSEGSLVKTCTKTTGLDVFSSIVRDIGQQLGNVSKSDPVQMGEDLVTAYSQALNTMDKLYAKGAKLEPGFDDMNMTSIGQFHRLKSLEKYSAHLVTASYWTLYWIIALASSLALVTASYYLKFKPVFRLSRAIVGVLVVSIASMVMLFFSAASVWHIHNVLVKKLGGNLKLAVVLVGLGFELLILNFFLSVSVMAVLFYIIYNKQI